MKLAWATDIHLNFLKDKAVRRFYSSIAQEDPDAVLITGDIGEANSVVRFLLGMSRAIKRPIYFVLGNHDFYGSSIQAVRNEMRTLTSGFTDLHYLTAEDVIELTPKTALVGHDGWADGRNGYFGPPSVWLNDFDYIEELKIGATSRDGLLQKLNELGDEAADYIRGLLPEAMLYHPNTILLTHVPPFQEASWYEGKMSEDAYLPHFSSKVMGDAILEAAQSFRTQNLTVLCGHSHGQGVYKPLPNVTVKTGGAEYGNPKIQEILVV